MHKKTTVIKVIDIEDMADNFSVGVNGGKTQKQFIQDMKTFELPKLKRTNVEGTRYYFNSNGERYPSVTEVIKPFQFPKEKRLNWINNKFGGDERKAQEYVNKKGFRGTKVHQIIELYLKNQSDYCRNHNQIHINMFNQLRPVLDQAVDNIKCQEEKLYSKELRVAGTVDCIAKFEGNLSVIDFKTKNVRTLKKYVNWHFVQCAAYASMWEEWTKIPIKKLVVLITTESGDSQVFVEDKEIIKTTDEWKIFIDAIANFN